MSTLLFNWAWDWLIGWGGLSTLVAIGAGLVWWFVPFLRTPAFHTALVALGFNVVFTMGFHNGASSTKAEWDKREQAAIDRGGAVRDEAEQEIPPVVAEPSVPEPGVVGPVRAPDRRPLAASPKWMRDDRYNRDNH